MDKLRAIEVFRRVIELGSFKAAAEDLNLSKAAISKNINELEDFLKTASDQSNYTKAPYYRKWSNLLRSS